MSEKVYYAAVDLGASSGRVMLACLDGQTISIQEIHRFENGPVEEQGSLRWDFQRLFGEVQEGLRKAFQAQPAIQSIGIDTWGVDFGLLDADGNLLENPYHYRDRRTEGMIEKAAEILPKREIYFHSGIQFMPFNTLFQLLAYRQQPIFSRAAKLLFMPNLMMYFLTGRIGAEYTIASTSQLMDMKSGRWSKRLLEAFGLPESLLPDIMQPGTPAGVLKPAFQQAWGCGPVPVIAVGTHDTASAVAAVPAESGRTWAYLSSGTWSLMGIEIPQAIIDQRTFERSFTNEGGVENTIRLLKNIMGLWLVQECRRCWMQQGEKYSFSELTQLASQAEPFAGWVDPDDIRFLSPQDMPAAINQYLTSTGQRPTEDKGQMIRIILESLAARYRQVLDWLEELLGRPIEVLHIVGGGTQNELLNQLTADAAGKRVLTGPVEATVLGNVLMQARAGGRIRSLEEGRQIIRRSFAIREYQPRHSAGWQTFLKQFPNA
ncbi:MAG: rhamnulokinase family protein [Anaerohalosphaeraceae bacterium]